jgi:transposase
VPDGQHDAAARIWSRVRDRLEKAKTTAQKASVAKDLIAGADGLTLGTLQEELPFWLKTEGVPTDWLPAAFAARIPEAVDCVVAAPSKLQRPSGDRIKTDARDARHLARLLHLNAIAVVALPSVEQEAAQDLVRAREDCRGDVLTVRHRLSKLLLRQGIVYYGGKAWTAKHEQWMRAHRFAAPGLQLAYDAAFDAMLATVDRRERLDAAITAMAADSVFTPVVTRLGCVRGVSTLTAFGLATEIGDWGWLSGRSIGAYLGLVPTEYSSGSTRSQGGVKDRQRPRPPAAGRSGLASPSTVSPGACSAAAMGQGRLRGPGARPGSQPSAARQMGPFR